MAILDNLLNDKLDIIKLDQLEVDLELSLHTIQVLQKACNFINFRLYNYNNSKCCA